MKKIGKVAVILAALISFQLASAQTEEAKLAKARGDAMMKANLMSEAIKEYEAATAADPTWWDAYKSLGTAYFKEKDFAKAGAAFEKAVTLKPDFVTGHYNMGFTYQKAGNFNKAISGYENYLKQKPEDPDGYFNLAECYEQTGDNDKAIANYEKYILYEKREKKADNIETAKAKIEELRKKKSAPIQESVAAATAAKDKQVGAFDANLSRAMEREGDSHMVANAYNLAITSYRDATVKDPQNDSAFFKLGISYEKTNRLSLAEAAYQSALAVNPNNFQAKEKLEALQAKMKEGGEPAPPGMIVEKIGGNAEELFKEGLKANNKGDYKKALALFDQSIQLRINFAPAHVAKGDAYMGLGKYNEAIHSYTQGMNIDPRIASPLFGLGEAYLAIGDKQRARTYLEKFLNLDAEKEQWRIKRAKQSLDLIKKGG